MEVSMQRSNRKKAINLGLGIEYIQQIKRLSVNWAFGSDSEVVRKALDFYFKHLNEEAKKGSTLPEVMAFKDELMAIDRNGWKDLVDETLLNDGGS